MVLVLFYRVTSQCEKKMTRSKHHNTGSIVFFTLIIFVLFRNSNFMVAQTIRIGVISDLHYTHPSLIMEKGKALETYLNGDRKLLLESDALLRKTVQLLLQENPDVVLIPGDLTKDGELVSHLGVAELLKPLREKGIKVLVIPGNHDINNPDAVAFHGDRVQKVETISADEFATIYNDYGYDEAVSRDEHSLSYTSEPVDGLRVISIDACRYYDNRFISKGDEEDFCITHGAIKPETMAWLRTEMQVAQILGKQVLVMIHHNVVEHFAHQGLFAAPYMVNNFRDVQEKFMEYGIKVLFTGHFHSSDISMVEGPDGHSLYEVETGSIVTYPCPYRIVEMTGDSLSIETKYIEEIDYPISEGVDFQTYARQTIEHGFREMFSGFINDYHHTLADYLPRWAKSLITIPNAPALTDIFMSNLSDSAIEMMFAHYCGNEYLLDNAAAKKEKMLTDLDHFINALSKASAGSLAGITERLIHRMPAIRKAKESVSSIWDDQVGIQNGDGHKQIYGKANDLRLTVRMRTVKSLPVTALPAVEMPLCLSASLWNSKTSTGEARK